MKRLYSYLADLTNICMTYCFFITFPVLLFIFEEQSYDSVLFVSVALPILISYLCNVFIHKLSLFLPIHLFMAILPLFMNLSPMVQFSTYLLVILLWIQDFYLWTNHRSDKRIFNIHGVFVIPCIFLYFYSNSKEQIFMSNISYYSGLIYTACFVLRQYLQNLNRIPANEHGSDNIGTSEIIHKNNKFVFSSIGLLFVFNVFFHQPVVEKGIAHAASWVGTMLQRLWAFLWYLPSHLIYGVDYDKRSGSSPRKNGASDQVFSITKSTKSTFTEISEKVFNGIVLTVLILVFIYLLYRLLKMLFSRFGTREKALEQEGIAGKPIETVEKLTSVRSKKHHHFTLMTSINDKIRQKYAHKINNLQAAGYKIKTSQTPNERSTEIQQKVKEDVSELTSYYNQARYSNQKLSNKDWQKVKELN